MRVDSDGEAQALHGPVVWWPVLCVKEVVLSAGPGGGRECLIGLSHPVGGQAAHMQ